MGLFVILNSDHLWKGGLQSHTSGWLGAQWSPCLELSRSPSTSKSQAKLSSQCWRKKGWKEDIDHNFVWKKLTVDNSDMRRTSTIWVKFENSKTSFPYLPRSPPPRLPPTATPPPPQDHLAWSEWVSRGVNPRLRAGPGTRRDLTFV